MIRLVRRLHSILREKVLSCSKTRTTYSRYQRARFVPLRSSVRPQINGDYVFKIRGDGGLRLIVNGQTLVDNFSSPTRPPVGYGPTVSYSGKITLQAGQTYSVEIDYRRVGGFFDTFEQGGLTGIQVSWASLQPPPNFNSYDAVVICAGISNEYEGEGEDRSFTLPEFQDELIKNIAAG